ncbi:MAG: hypothetical protein K2O04_03980 [Clostridiales bacterium]|nr:hypothetical protein [Clostridiales bacterium]
MTKRLLKTLLLPILALAMAFAFIACDGENAPAVTYSVTYVLGEGAQGTVPTETNKAIGEKFIIKSADGITNGDLTFMGWSDGNIIYQAGDEYTMPTKAVVFTAEWAMCGEPLDKYSVTYDLNGGTGQSPPRAIRQRAKSSILPRLTDLPTATRSSTAGATALTSTTRVRSTLCPKMR